VTALRWGGVGRTGRHSRSPPPRTVIRWLAKERRRDFGRRCRAGQRSIVFFRACRGRRFRSFSERSTWLRFTFCMVLERFATWFLWVGPARVSAICSTIRPSNARFHALRGKFAHLASFTRISGQRIFCGMRS